MAAYEPNLSLDLQAAENMAAETMSQLASNTNSFSQMSQASSNGSNANNAGANANANAMSDDAAHSKKQIEASKAEQEQYANYRSKCLTQEGQFNPRGLDALKNISHSFQFLKNAAETNPEAMFDLATCYRFKWGSESKSKSSQERHKLAFDLVYKAAAEHQLPIAQWALAEFYLNKSLTPDMVIYNKKKEKEIRFEKAFKLYLEAASPKNVNNGTYPGFTEAQFKLYTLYKAAHKFIPAEYKPLELKDDTTRFTYQQEKEWCKTAAELGNPEAQFTYGYYLLNEQEADLQFNLAASQNYQPAIQHLNKLKIAELGVQSEEDESSNSSSNRRTKNRTSAVKDEEEDRKPKKLSSLARERKEAMEIFNHLLRTGARKSTRNTKYKNGEHSGSDSESIMDTNGDNENETYTSALLLDGQYFDEGIEKLKKLSRDELVSLITVNKPAALFDLGTCLRFGYGEGVEQDLARGFDLIQKAAEQNFRLAQWIMGEFYHLNAELPHIRSLELEERNKIALKWYIKAAGSGKNNEKLAAAYTTIGICFQDGIGIPACLEFRRKYLGKQFLKLAKDMGDKSAKTAYDNYVSNYKVKNGYVVESEGEEDMPALEAAELLFPQSSGSEDFNAFSKASSSKGVTFDLSNDPPEQNAMQDETPSKSSSSKPSGLRSSNSKSATENARVERKEKAEQSKQDKQEKADESMKLTLRKPPSGGMGLSHFAIKPPEEPQAMEDSDDSEEEEEDNSLSQSSIEPNALNASTPLVVPASQTQPSTHSSGSNSLNGSNSSNASNSQQAVPMQLTDSHILDSFANEDDLGKLFGEFEKNNQVINGNKLELENELAVSKALQTELDTSHLILKKRLTTVREKMSEIESYKKQLSDLNQKMESFSQLSLSASASQNLGLQPNPNHTNASVQMEQEDKELRAKLKLGIEAQKKEFESNQTLTQVFKKHNEIQHNQVKLFQSINHSAHATLRGLQNKAGDLEKEIDDLLILSPGQLSQSLFVPKFQAISQSHSQSQSVTTTTPAGKRKEPEPDSIPALASFNASQTMNGNSVASSNSNSSSQSQTQSQSNSQTPSKEQEGSGFPNKRQKQG